MLNIIIFIYFSIKLINEFNTCIVTASGKGLCDFFFYHVGEYSYSKVLSKELLFSNDEIKKAFISSWLDGDGCVSKDHGQVIGITVSYNLINCICLMLSSLKIGYSINKVSGKLLKINKDYPAYQGLDYYRITICSTEGEELVKNSNRLSFVNKGKPKKQKYYFNDCALNTIIEIKLAFCNDYCYNIITENNSPFIANGIAVCSCK